MQEKTAARNRAKFELMKQIRAVEQLRTIDKEIEMVSRLISGLSVLYMDAWNEVCSARARVRHALFILDDSGKSEYILEKRAGV